MADQSRTAIQPDKFVSDGSGVTLTQCRSCKHWLPGTWTCDPFPSSIPLEIRENEFDHRQRYEGDDGIGFEPKKDVSSDYLNRLYIVLDTVAPHTT